MTRGQAIEMLKELKEPLKNSLNDDVTEKAYALDFAIADMESLQDIINITDGIITD